MAKYSGEPQGQENQFLITGGGGYAMYGQTGSSHTSEQRQQGPLCEESLSPDFRPVAYNKTKIPDFDPSNITRQ